MSRVWIVTDSAQDFPHEVLESRGISVVPLTVHFGDESYRDGYELRGHDFYEKLRTSPHHPRTSQPPPAAFQAVFEKLTSDGSSVIAITLSAALSGTYQSACIARDALQDRRIDVVDSRQASGGYGVMSIVAAEMAEAGASHTEVLQEVQRMVDQAAVYFSVDTLDYLAKNGRIGRAQHFLGTVLNMKPILTLDREGYVAAVERVRGKGKVIPRLIELLSGRISSRTPVYACVMNADAPTEGEKLKEAVCSSFDVRRLYEVEIGSVIGTHVGPGTLALCLIPCNR